MKMWVRAVMLLLVLMMAVPMAGCEKEGPAERQGKKIDQAMEAAKQKADDAGEHLKDASEDVKKIFE